MAEIDDFDLDRSVAQAWAEFQARLSEIVSVIDDTADLTIGTESGQPDAPYVRFHSPAPDLVRCEAVSNGGLREEFRLLPAQVDRLSSLGFRPPDDAAPLDAAVVAVELPQEESDRLSEMAVGALRDVYGVPHPVFLAPDQLAEVLQPPPEPLRPPSSLLPERQRRPANGRVLELDADDFDSTLPRDLGHLNALVDVELTTMFGHPPLRDDEGDVTVRVGSTMVFLRTAPDGHDVVVFAAVVHDVSGRSRAAEVLNDLNVESRWVKFQLVRDRVFASVSVLARPFVPAHLHQAVRVLSDVADGIDEDLAAKLDGRTTFTDPEPA